MDAAKEKRLNISAPYVMLAPICEPTGIEHSLREQGSPPENSRTEPATLRAFLISALP